VEQVTESEPEPSGLRLWAGVLLEITIFTVIAIVAVILLPLLLIAGAVYLGIYAVRRLRGRGLRDETRPSRNRNDALRHSRPS
jgi:hypothetical protein